MPTDGTVSIIGVVVGSENYDAEKSLPFVTSPVQWQNVTQIVPPIHSNAHQTIRVYLQNKKSHKINIILLGESTDWPTKTDFAYHKYRTSRSTRKEKKELTKEESPTRSASTKKRVEIKIDV